MTCQTFGCTREPRRSSSGWTYATCEDCTSRALTEAFASQPREPQSWHDRARAHSLPTLVVGGIPSEPIAAPESRHAGSPGSLPRRSDVAMVTQRVA